MLETFAAVKASRALEIAGVTVDSNEFKTLLNEATRKLMRRGDWAGTVVSIYLCATKGCVVFPRYVGQVRKLNICKQPIPIRNVYWDFFEANAWTNWNSCSWLGMPCESRLINYGRTPIVQDILGEGRYVRLYAVTNADYGKTVTIFGVDNNDIPLRHRDANGDWKDGIVLAAKNPYDQTDIYVRRIDRVIKQVTQQEFRLYAFNAADAVLETLATYEPSETNPAYQKFKLKLDGCCWPGTSTNCDTQQGLAGLIKLQYVPVVDDNDLVLIDNLDALKAMMQSIRCAEGQDFQSAKVYELEAVRELNHQLKDENPDDQISVNVDPFNSTLIGFQQMN